MQCSNRLKKLDLNLRDFSNNNHLVFEKADVILHAFDWPYSQITKNAREISELGYKTVLVSPAMKSLRHENGTAWWQRYQPQDYRIIDNQLGNTEDFTAMVTALNEVGVRVYADVVFNHMANEAYLRTDLDYPSEKDRQLYEQDWQKIQTLKVFGDLSQPLFTENDFVEAFGIEDWKNKWQVQNGRISAGQEDPGLPTLRPNDHVVAMQQAYLKALKVMGVSGFRIDAAKHMSIEHLTKVWTKEITEDVHIFGEIITDGGATQEEYKTFLQPYLEKTQLGAYDFPLFTTVFKAFQSDGDLTTLVNPYSFGQALSSSRAITFAITHDIPNNQVFQGLLFDEESEWLAYSYILGRDGGVPLIYTDLNTSSIVDRTGEPRWLNSWRDPRMARMIAFHNFTHGETMVNMWNHKHCLIFARGEKGLVTINKSDQAIPVSLDWHSDMTDLLTGYEHKVEQGQLHLVIPANVCQMMITR
ncbi:alpha-amylase family protein [Vibrio sp. MA40-2]|uniref:alpha-amylase family protein n=1 Tax=Vibrio sp. MA40-2 TaxID=3391828 RepID=UPI0039A627F1